MAQIRVIKAHSVHIALAFPEVLVQPEAVASAQLYHVLPKAADANLGPLQIGQNTDVSARSRGLFANSRGDLCVLLRRAVTEIEAKDVNTGCNQSGNGTALGG